MLLATFVVNNTGDSGAGSLRQAILDSNAAPGSAPNPNVIDFEIGLNLQTIEPRSALPSIAAAVAIDTTTSSLGSQQEVEIRGDLAGPGVDGLTVDPGGSGSTIKGLVVDDFSGSGIRLVGGGDNLIAFNFIGTDPSGSSAMPNGGDGVTIEGSTGNTIGGTAVSTFNLISGNVGNGIAIGPGSSTNLIERNKIGLNSNFELAVPNGGDGVLVVGSTGDTIGGAASGQTNLISGNLGAGIVLGAGSSGETLLGNDIGEDAFGSRVVPNGGDGITVQGSTGDTIGGPSTALGNVISGNSGNGITIGPGSAPLVLQGNRIGTDATGSAALGNAGDGVAIEGASDLVIGGTIAGATNVISSNLGAGIAISAPTAGADLNVQVQGNFIGTDLTGFASLANRGSGVLIAGVRGTVIGGTSAAARNLINGNTFTDTGVVQEAPEVAIVGPGASGNLVEGDYIGLTDSGFAFGGGSGSTGLSTTSRFNTGVLIQEAPGNTIGGTTPGAGDVISGGGSGVVIQGLGSSGNLVEGDFIGLDATGRFAQGNAFDGIDVVGASGNTIGGSAAGARNVVSASGRFNVVVETSSAPGSPRASGNTIAGNLIGPDASQSIGLGIAVDGLLIQDSDGDRVVGNTISGNDGSGLEVLGSTGIVAQGNLIGTGASGINKLLGNKFFGVFLDNSPGNTIGGALPGQGNVISGNSGVGIGLDGPSSTGNLVLGNAIGLDPSGQVAAANLLDGVYVFEAGGNTIGGADPGDTNIISGNGLNGVEIQGASGNLVIGNLIGTDLSGKVALANARDGVFLNGAPGNTVGGTAAGSLNVISGNTLDGVGISGVGATGNVVLGNIIGTSLDYLNPTPTALPSLVNRADGVRIDGFLGDVSGNTIGGSSAGSGNVISGNLGNGVEIDNPGAVLEVVIGNIIGNVVGTDPATGQPLRQPNFQSGVAIVNASSNQVGGTSPGDRNVISGNNKDGVEILGGNFNEVAGNSIGSDPVGFTDKGNLGDGVSIHTGTMNTIGGTNPGAGNLIFGNGGSGVSISQSLANTVQGNQIGVSVADTIYSGALNADGSLHELGNNEDGIQVNDASAGNLIGGVGPGARNVISGNLKNGVSVINASLSNVIQGNYVGLDSSGLTGLGNRLNGIYVTTSGNLIGGTLAGSANVASGNLNSGVVLSTASATNNLVVGNLIGTDANGAFNLGGSPGLGADNTALGNRQDGLFINDDAGLNTIGGFASSDRNVISGNGSNGIQILGSNGIANGPGSPGAPGNLVVGNFIGTGASGLDPDGNAAAGVFLYNAPDNLVGQAGPGGGNLISGNLGPGVAIQGEAATANLVVGNRIGTDATGSSSDLLGNQGDGVTLVEAVGNQVGGFGPGDGNLIFGNGGSGVAISSGSGFTTVAGDVISENSGDGVLVASGSSNALVSGNRIGTDASGESPLGNALDGVRVVDAGSGVQVVSNAIAANRGGGVVVTGASSGSTIAGNRIGLDASGEAAMGNGVGVEVDGVPGVTIGGTLPGSGNVISGNGVGVLVTPPADTATPLGDAIEGNVIGLDVLGRKAIGNVFGVFLNDSVGVTIGGTSAGSGDVISGNTGVGVQVFRVSAGGSGDAIEGDIIGLDPSGTAVPAGARQPVGVFLNSASNNTVGGTVAGARNVISGNTTGSPNDPSYGVSIFGQSNARPLDNVVEGDVIGLDANANRLPTVGGAPVQSVGVVINTSSGNVIGGVAGPARNTIGGNVVGVQVAGVVEKFANSPTGNVIEGDTIDLNTDGVFLNGSSGNSVVGDDLSLNTSIGLSIVGGLATGNAVMGNTISRNGSAASGVLAGGGVGDGVYIQGAKGNTIEHNTIAGNGLGGKSPDGVGVYVFDNASGNVVASNTIRGNTAYGILVFNSAGNLGTIPRTGRSANAISGSGIASFREYTGPATTSTKTTTGSSTPQGPKSRTKPKSAHASAGTISRR